MIEIGSGWGITGVYCAKYFSAQVLCTDIDAAVAPYAQLLATVNKTKIDFKPLGFADFSLAKLKGVHTVFGCDMCYSESLIQPLLDLIKQCSKVGVTQFLMSDPGRWPFLDLCKKLKFNKSAHVLSWERVNQPTAQGFVLRITF